MTRNPNELTIENSAVVLIDYQPWVAFSVESIDRSVLINNVHRSRPRGEDTRGADYANDRRGNRERPRGPYL
jgi:hypothetical protein